MAKQASLEQTCQRRRDLLEKAVLTATERSWAERHLVQAEAEEFES